MSLLYIYVVPNLSIVQSRARDVTRQSDIQQLSIALASYKLHTTIYPTWVWEIWQSLSMLAPLYIRTIPGDPSWESMITTNGSQSWVGQYLYVSLESWKWYALVSVSEWGGVNANWVSHSTSTSLTGILPWFINTTDKVTIINKSLCASISDGALARDGLFCVADRSLYQMKYVVANK